MPTHADMMHAALRHLCLDLSVALFAAGGGARQALHARIADAQRRAARAQGRARRANKDLSACQEEYERVKALTRGARLVKQRLTLAAAAEQDWLGRAGAARVAALEAGPLTPQVMLRTCRVLCPLG